MELTNQSAYITIDEVSYPAVGFGTYRLKDNVCEKATLFAADVGYRIMDTATFYGNFEPIGRMLGTKERSHFYIISKVWPDSQSPEQLKEDLKETLERLHTPYLDGYLLHWPNSKESIENTLHAMDELRSKKLIRHIGLSNVNANHVKRALEVGVPITWVQVEMHPQFYDPKLLEFCQKNSILVQAWAPLGRGRMSQDPLLIKIGEKSGKTPAQIALRWILQHGCIPLPQSKNEEHIVENFESFDFQLTKEEMEEIDAQARVGSRYRVTEDRGLGFTDEFDFTYEECWPTGRFKGS